MWGRGGVSRFSVENFLYRSAENFCGGTIQCFRIIVASKKFMHNKAISLLSVDFFCLTMPEKFCLSKKFWYRKRSCIGGRASWFCRKNFSFHLTEKLRGGSSVFWNFSGKEKSLWIGDVGEGGITFFRRKFFVSQCRKFLRGNHSMFQNICGFEKFYA